MALMLTLLFSTALTLPLATSPLSLGLMILMLAALSAAMMASISSWYGTIFFIIYIGGLLIMFAYFSAITPNQQLPATYPSIFTLSLAAALVIGNNLPPDHQLLNLSQEIKHTSAQLIMAPMNLLILLALASTLFIALIAVVKVSQTPVTPLRPFLKPLSAPQSPAPSDTP